MGSAEGGWVGVEGWVERLGVVEGLVDEVVGTVDGVAAGAAVLCRRRRWKRLIIRPTSPSR